MRTDYAIKIPYAQALSRPVLWTVRVTGLEGSEEQARTARPQNGMTAYDLLTKLQSGDKSDDTRARFDEVKRDLDYLCCSKRYTSNVTDATDDRIKAAVDDSHPVTAAVLRLPASWFAVGMLMPGADRYGLSATAPK